jgi:hypothetical protein
MLSEEEKPSEVDNNNLKKLKEKLKALKKELVYYYNNYLL